MPRRPRSSFDTGGSRRRGSGGSSGSNSGDASRRDGLAASYRVEPNGAWPDLRPVGADAEAGVEVRFVHPFQAVKDYVCPGCQQTVTAGTGHVVVVPVTDPGLRRHWHRSCWEHRSRRRPGR